MPFAMRSIASAATLGARLPGQWTAVVIAIRSGVMTTVTRDSQSPAYLRRHIPAAPAAPPPLVSTK